MKELSDRLDEFIEAYQGELYEARRKGNKRRVDLDHGRITHVGETNSIVTFANPGSVNVNEGDTAKLVIPSGSYQVTVIGVSHSDLALNVESPLHGSVEKATLELDVGFLYEAIIRRLISIRDNGPEEFFHPSNGNWAVHPESPGNNPSPVAKDTRLNVRQGLAVESMLGSQSSFIWGPPGTGKTSTVAAAVVQMMRQGMSVLLVSTTNAAVDVLALRVADLVASDGPLVPGTILRDGYPTQTLVAAYDGVLTRDGALAALGHDERALVRLVDLAIDQATRQQARFHRMDDQYSTYKEQWRERLVELRDARSGLVPLADAAEQTLLHDAQVVASTAHRVATGAVPRGFDAVVVDEASMINLPLVWLASGQALRHVVIAGDFRQLGPITRTERARAFAALRTSAFEESGIADNPDSERFGSLVALTDQYRMVQPINDLVSDHFYPDSPLMVASAVEIREPAPALRDRASVMRIDVSGHRMWAGRSRSEKSRYNLANAQIIGALARIAANSGTPLTSDRLIVISPYRAQASILSSVLDEVAGIADSRGARSLASTVHRYQGGEARTVILDLTDAHGVEVGQFYQGDGLESDTSRLINVAISRAQDQLVVVGDFTRVLSALPPRSPVHRAFSVIHSQGQVVTVEDVAATLADAACFTVVNRNPTKQVLDEIATARLRVVVFSELISLRRRANLAKAATAAMANGASIRVVTSPPRRDMAVPICQALLEWCDEMRTMGAVVDLRQAPNGYESAVIIDDSIWVARNRRTDGLFGDEESPTAFRSTSAALVTEALLHMGRRPPSGQRFVPGRESTDCASCGRPTAFGDTFWTQYLYCPYCRGLPITDTTPSGAGPRTLGPRPPGQRKRRYNVATEARPPRRRRHSDHQAVAVEDLDRMTCTSCGRVMNRDGWCLCHR